MRLYSVRCDVSRKTMSHVIRIVLISCCVIIPCCYGKSLYFDGPLIAKRSPSDDQNNSNNAIPSISLEDGGSGSHDNHTDGKSHKSHGIHVASWNYEYVEQPFIIALFLIIAGVCKVGFHHADFLSSIVPESCLLHEDEVFPIYLTPRLFFLFLLPPIILESAYSLHDRVFFDNVGTVMLFAVVGTVLNCFIIGPSLYLLAETGAMGTIHVSLVQCLVFSSLIVAVDPVAVLAIFQEIGVNNVLYFLVFGESLLNDAVTVVLYNMMKEFNIMEEITAAQVILGIAAFFTVSLGGLFVGLVCGVMTALITKYTVHVRVVEPLAVFVLAYMSFLVAEMFHFSGIISTIGCGLTQANYAFHNISQKSSTTVKYFSKMQSATSDCVIFLFLGMTLFRSRLIWHTGFTLWTLVLCLAVRFLVVFFLTFVVNKAHRLKKIDLEEQFIMAYGGLRGAVCFSLVDLLDPSNIPHRDMFVTTTLVVIFFTVFVQGISIKPLVKFLRIGLKEGKVLCIYEEINLHVTDHVMAGIEEVLGRKGQYFWREILEYYDDKYLRNVFQRTPSKTDERIMATFEKIALRQHFENLSSSKFPEKYASSLLLFNEDERGSLSSDTGEDLSSSEGSSPEPETHPDEDIETLERENMTRRRSRAFSLIPTIVAAERRRESRPFLRQSTRPEVSWGPDAGKQKGPKLIGNPTVEDVRKMLAKNPTNLLHQERTNRNIRREEDTDILQLLQEKQARTRRMSMCLGNTYDGIFQGALLQNRQHKMASFDEDSPKTKKGRSHSSFTPMEADKLKAKRSAEFSRSATFGGEEAPLRSNTDDRSPLLERSKGTSGVAVVDLHAESREKLSRSGGDIDKITPLSKSPERRRRKERDRVRKWRQGRLKKAKTFDVAEPLLEDIGESESVPMNALNEESQEEQRSSPSSKTRSNPALSVTGGQGEVTGGSDHLLDIPVSGGSGHGSKTSVARNPSYVDAVSLGEETTKNESQETSESV